MGLCGSREIPIHRWPDPMRQERPGKKSEQPREQSSNTSLALSLLSHIHTRTRLQCIVLRGARGRYSIRPEREGSLLVCVTLNYRPYTSSSNWYSGPTSSTWCLDREEAVCLFVCVCAHEEKSYSVI